MKFFSKGQLSNQPSHHCNIEGTSKRLRCLTIALIIHSYWAAGQREEKKKARDLQLKSYKVSEFYLRAKNVFSDNFKGHMYDFHGFDPRIFFV